MSFYEITGGRPLAGTVAVQGAKNSVLPMMAAALLAPGVSVIHNCPDLTDVSAAMDILRLLGCSVTREGDTVTINAASPVPTPIPEQLSRELRSSVIFMGAMLSRMGTGELAYPGGCDLGPRPIDLHLSALRMLGADIREEQGTLRFGWSRWPRGREVCLALPSVGATENAMLAACGCPGVTTIVGAAREPEIVDLGRFLAAMGADIAGVGESTIVIRGGKALFPARYTVMGDRIAGATYLCAAAAAGGEIEVTGLRGEHLSALLAILEEAGCVVYTQGVSICLRSDGLLEGVSPVRTGPYPAFPTDCQPLLMAALAGGNGSTIFVENMFDSRYRHVNELARMGADIRVDGRVAVVKGRGRLHGASVRGTDLRGTAALVIAALSAQGVSQVHDLRYIRRGYDGLERDLAALGAEIRIEP